MTTLKSMVAGAFSGGVVTTAVWMLAEFAWDGIGATMGGLLSMGFGGPAPPPPSLQYNWARYGSVVGLTAGAAVGLCVGLTGRAVRGWVVGMLAAAVCVAMSAASVLFLTGSELLDEELLALAFGLFVASVLLGGLVGASTDFLFGRFGRRAGESSAL